VRSPFPGPGRQIAGREWSPEGTAALVENCILHPGFSWPVEVFLALRADIEHILIRLLQQQT
jgi:hypothetical protein